MTASNMPSRSQFAPSQKSMPKQSGAALLTVLLLLVLVMVLVGSISVATRQMMADNAYRQATAELAEEQSRQSAMLLLWLNQSGGGLHKLSALDSFRPIPSLKPYIKTQVQFLDESGKLNLNQLYHDGKTDEVFLSVLQNALSQHKIPAGEIKALSDDLLSYIDTDTTLPSGGNEPSNDTNAGVYFANRPMQTIDELLYLPNMTGERVQQLKHTFTASPILGKLNVNTATPEALKALAPTINASELSVITALQANENSFDSNQAFWQLPPFNQLDSKYHTLTDVRITRLSATFYSQDQDGNQLTQVYHFAKTTEGKFVITYVADGMAKLDSSSKK